MIEQYGTGVIEAIAKGTSLSEKNLPRFPSPSRPERDPLRADLVKRLKSWRVLKGAELGIEAGIIANNDLLEKVAEAIPENLADLQLVPGIKGWQVREFGNELLSVLNQP